MRFASVFLVFFAFFAYAVLFRFIVGRAGNKNKKNIAEYLAEEHASLFSRSRPIDEDFFIKLDMNKFPITEYSNIENMSGEMKSVYNKQIAVLKKAQNKMINDCALSNLEIKQRFGVNNLERIGFYEDNFRSFVFAVFDWAKALCTAGLKADAIIALEALVELGTDFSQVHGLLDELQK